jgi:hypothetical protein
MLCSSANLAQRRFMVRMWVAAGLCMLFALAAALAFRLGHLSGILAYPMAILPALPIIGSLVLTGTYLAEETDEFQRNLLVQSLLGGIGVTLAATTVCGYLENFVHTSHLDPILVFPIFWFSTAASHAIVRLRYR